MISIISYSSRGLHGGEAIPLRGLEAVVLSPGGFDHTKCHIPPGIKYPLGVFLTPNFIKLPGQFLPPTTRELSLASPHMGTAHADLGIKVL